MDVNERMMNEEIIKITEILRNSLNNNLTVDEICVLLEIDYDRLMMIINGQNKYALQVNC